MATLTILWCFLCLVSFAGATVIAACDETCATSCKFGFLSEGCPRCLCAHDPCANVQCPFDLKCVAIDNRWCPFTHGCSMVAFCKWIPPDQQPPCAKVCSQKHAHKCKFGLQSSGCPRCKCAKDPCKSKTCTSLEKCVIQDKSCKFHKQCPKKAVCKPSACERICKKAKTTPCTFGLENKDCPRCTCAADPCVNHTCAATEDCVAQDKACDFTKQCPQEAVCEAKPACNKVCPEKRGDTCKFGLEATGCPRCTCAKNPCKTVKCAKHKECVVVDDKNCAFTKLCAKIGKCKKITVCEKICIHKRKNPCKFGLLNKGCPRCKCAPDPCAHKKCTHKKKCQAAAGTCDFTKQCPMVAKCILPAKPKACVGCANKCKKYGFFPESCPMCVCRNNPCLNLKCGNKETCVVVAHTCTDSSSDGCPSDARCLENGCLEPLHKGKSRCSDDVTRYFFNTSSAKCESFTFSGCGGNNNNFPTKKDCRTSCNIH